MATSYQVRRYKPVRISKAQIQGLAMMRAGLNKMTDADSARMAGKRINDPPKASPRVSKIRKLFARQNGLCHLCGEIMTLAKIQRNLGPRDANIDHYIPRSKGGSNAMANLRAAHYECNHAKGNRFIQSCEPETEFAALDEVTNP